MSPVTDEDDIKGLATHLAEGATDGSRRLLEEHSASLRWLMASLLAVNSGALALLRDAKIQPPLLLVSAGAGFYLGIAFALLIAVFGQRAAQFQLEPMTKLSVFWAGVAQDGEIDEVSLKEIMSDLSRSNVYATLTPIAGWLSFLGFTMGLLATAFGLPAGE